MYTNTPANPTEIRPLQHTQDGRPLPALAIKDPEARLLALRFMKARRDEEAGERMAGERFDGLA